MSLAFHYSGIMQHAKILAAAQGTISRQVTQRSAGTHRLVYAVNT